MSVPSTGPQATPTAVTAVPARNLRTAKLRTQVVDSLRQRLKDHEWTEGHKLPTEAELASEYGVSRSTIRSALDRLESQGLTITRHGRGTFVSPFGSAITAGLQELQSMTDTIRAHGMEPHIEFHDSRFREATEDEAKALDLEPGVRVLATDRLIMADDVQVAFSYEIIPATLLPAGLEAEALSGSLFALLDQVGISPTTAVAEIHAASGADIGWGDREPDQVYVYLRQVHYEADASPVIYSRTYFLEGRFQFSILRVR